MHSSNLVSMGNQIAEFFASWDDREQALEGFAQHLKRYWAPSMRRSLAEQFASGQAEGLHPLLEDVLRRQRLRA